MVCFFKNIIKNKIDDLQTVWKKKMFLLCIMKKGKFGNSFHKSLRLVGIVVLKLRQSCIFYIIKYDFEN